MTHEKRPVSYRPLCYLMLSQMVEVDAVVFDGLAVVVQVGAVGVAQLAQRLVNFY